MAYIKINEWEEHEKNSPLFEFKDAEFHPYAWTVKRWWYKGENAPLETCVRVDYQKDVVVLIDGTQPGMRIDVYALNDLFWFDNYTAEDNFSSRAIRRILIARDYRAVIRGESDEYIDIDFNVRNGYIVRHDNLDPYDVVGWDDVTPEYFDCTPIPGLPRLDSDDTLAFKSTLLFHQCVNIPALPLLSGTYNTIAQLPTIGVRASNEVSITRVFGKTIDVNLLPIL